MTSVATAFASTCLEFHRVYVPSGEVKIVHTFWRSNRRLLEAGWTWTYPWEIFQSIDIPWGDKIVSCYDIPVGNISHRFEDSFTGTTTMDHMEFEAWVTVVYQIHATRLRTDETHHHHLLEALRECVGLILRDYAKEKKGMDIYHGFSTARSFVVSDAYGDTRREPFTIKQITVTRIRIDPVDRKVLRMEYSLTDALVVAAAGGHPKLI